MTREELAPTNGMTKDCSVENLTRLVRLLQQAYELTRLFDNYKSSESLWELMGEAKKTLGVALVNEHLISESRHYNIKVTDCASAFETNI